MSAQPQTPPRIVSIILDWATANIDKLVSIQWYKGGWEGWAQVEIALIIEAYLAKQKGVAPPTGEFGRLVFREYGVFTDTSEEADIAVQTLLPSSTGTDKKYVYEIVELKCASSFQDIIAFEYLNKEAEFVAKFVKDINKIAKIDTKFKPYEALAIMISANENHIANCDATIKAQKVQCASVRKTVSQGKSVAIYYVATKYNPDGVVIPTLI